MTASTPLDGQDRDLLVSGALSVRQLAEHFESTPGIIKRAQRQIREGQPVVYLSRPPRERQKVKYRYCSKAAAPPKEAQESPMGLDHVAACDGHLADLQRVYSAQLRASR
jgi:hypothetical protein